MADEQFDSIDAIEKHYGRLRKAAEKDGDDAAVKDIGLQEREAKADFRERSAQQRELLSHRRDAIAKAGIPEDFHEFVTGNTPEEIDASVTKIKERVEKLTSSNGADDDAARKLYGSPIGNGGGNPPPPRSTDDEAWIGDFQKRFEGEGTAQVSVAEIEKYARILGGNHLARELARNSNIFRRHGITEQDIVDFQEGRNTQKRPAGAGVSRPPRQ